MFKKLFIASAIILATALGSNAQESGKGWFAGAGAGLNIGADGLLRSNPDISLGFPALQVYGGYWFSPAFGVRFGVQGLTAGGFYGNDNFNFLATPVDVLFDVPSLFFGSPLKGPYKLAAYFSAFPAFGLDSSANTIGGGAGLLNTIRVNGPWSAYVDLRASLLGQKLVDAKSDGFIALGTVTGGVQYNFGAGKQAPVQSAAEYRRSDVTTLQEESAKIPEKPQFVAVDPSKLNVELGDDSGGIKGTIVSRGTREGIAGAVIHLFSGAYELAQIGTDEEGRFSVVGVPNGMYTLVIEAPDCLENRVQVTVNDGYVKNMFNISMTAVQRVAEVDDDNFTQFDMDDTGYNDNPTILFGSNDVFNNIAGFNFSAVRFRARGYSSESQDVYLAGVKLNDAITGYSPFSLWSGLNEAMRSKDTVNGSEVSDYGFGGYNGLTNIFGNATSVRKGLRGSVMTNSSLYRLRLMGSYATGLMDNGWALAFNVSARLGGNDWIDGVYYRSFAYYAAADKVWGDTHKLGFIFFATPGQRGAQNASTQEVYDLVGDNMYNSNWGYQNGKVRNTRVRKTNEPVAVLKYDFTPSDKFNAHLTALYRFGKNGYTALDWYDAQDPRPDYYRNLPSYFFDTNTDLNRSNFEKAAWAKEMWTYPRTYSNYTHVDWDRLYNINRNQESGRSKYIQEERHVDQRDFNLAATFKYRPADFLTVTGGVNGRVNRTEYYKVVADLLGGKYFVDTDNFAERDFAATPYKLQNDIDHYLLTMGGSRTVVEGEKYGYDYYAQVRNLGAWLNGTFTFGNLSANVGGRVGYESFWREGLLRKGLFPGKPESAAMQARWEQFGITPTEESSYGTSDVSGFITYAGKLGLNYVIGGSQRVYANLGYFTEAPKFNQAFLSPRTRNTLMDDLKTSKTFSADVNWQYSANGINVRTTAYYTTIKDQSKVMSAYDDLQNAFSNFAINGIDQRNMGVELGFKVPTYIVPGLSLQGVLAAGRYEYTSNPTMTQTVDNSADKVMDNVPVYYWMSNPVFKKDENGVYTGEISRWQKHYVPSTPQIAASLGLSYNVNYWFIDADVEYFGESYLDMNPLYRTDYATAGPDNYVTPGEIEYMTTQEKFDPQVLLNLSVGKSWFIRYKYQLGFSFNVKNLLNNRNVRTGGYEQTRIVDNTVSKERFYRFDPKYFYMAGTNYMLNVYFRF